MRRVLVMSSSGLASRTMKSASRPRRNVPLLASLKLRRSAGRGDDALHRRQAGVDHGLQLELFSHSEQMIFEAGVRTEDDFGAGFAQLRHARSRMR